ncbi:hypothetical protein VE03_10726 [Pseudogymnoascus sp. 23342-1-I1]|nr:hypothetical protein VE03_10726 [Pseudogymnoascus sp. 23342-1-I1]
MSTQGGVAAAAGNSLPIAKLLLDNRANINMQSGGLNTALIGAVWRNHEKMVDYLLQEGADPDLRGEFRLAAEKGNSTIMKLLPKAPVSSASLATAVMTL